MFRVIPHSCVINEAAERSHEAHMAHAKKVGVSTPCTASSAGYGGTCHNCGFGMLRKDKEKIKKPSDKKITETVADDEDVHLQSAHDAIRSRIAKCRREGKDCKALEARLARVAALIDKKD